MVCTLTIQLSHKLFLYCTKYNFYGVWLQHDIDKVCDVHRVEVNNMTDQKVLVPYIVFL